MDKQKIIEATRDYVEETLKGEGSGHDWWHILRVWNTAKAIGEKEKADMFVVELAALLHDIADWKFNGGDEMAGARVFRKSDSMSVSYCFYTVLRCYAAEV